MKDVKNYPLRMKPDLFEALVTRAEKNNRSINAEINTIIEDGLKSTPAIGTIKDGVISIQEELDRW